MMMVKANFSKEKVKEFIKIKEWINLNLIF
jgi:hypothetical protein